MRTCMYILIKAEVSSLITFSLLKVGKYLLVHTYNLTSNISSTTLYCYDNLHSSVKDLYEMLENCCRDFLPFSQKC
uniref:Uncharacterized protein n=1 Tax=Anguilla anguilla TaxID=7936 RepID=A0A0E9X7P6_ANGAN